MAPRYSIIVMLLFATVATLTAQTIEVIGPSPRSVVGTAPYWSSIEVSGGMAWDYKINKYYWLDSCNWTVRSFDWCPYTGDISNQQIVYNYTNGYENATSLNVIKGMDIDRNGHLYLTSSRDSRIIKVDPKTGTELMIITLPTPQISAVTFGGDDMDCLFVTTASAAFYGEVPDPGGKLFKVCDIGAQGHYPHKANLKCKQKSIKWAEL